MFKSQLIEEIAEKTHFSIEKSQTLVDLFFGVITKELCNHGRVEIRGFGVFEIRKYRAHIGRNPATGANFEVKEKHSPRWKTSLELQQRINGRGI